MKAFLRRARVLLSAIRSPADAWLALRMIGWRVVLPVLKWTLPLPRLARLMWAGTTRERDPAGEEQIATLARGLSGRRRNGSRFNNCLERSLVAYRYLSRAGAEPELVVGVSRDLPVRGHAWVSLDGEPLGDRVDEFEEVTAFGPEGALIARAAPDDVLAAMPPPLGRSRLPSKRADADTRAPGRGGHDGQSDTTSA